MQFLATFSLPNRGSNGARCTAEGASFLAWSLLARCLQTQREQRAYAHAYIEPADMFDDRLAHHAVDIRLPRACARCADCGVADAMYSTIEIIRGESQVAPAHLEERLLVDLQRERRGRNCVQQTSVSSGRSLTCSIRQRCYDQRLPFSGFPTGALASSCSTPPLTRIRALWPTCR